MSTTELWLEHAWIDGEIGSGVRITVDDGRFTAVHHGVPRFTDVEQGRRAAGAQALPGLTIPGLANGHSHAFHRALRGRVQVGRGTFWSWRDRMYALAATLTPDSYHALAGAVFAEMLATGFTSVAEFHYLHHGPDGRPYAQPNAMAEALIDAARSVGIRITLLDTCYLAGGIDRPVEGVQARFSDGDATRWARRVGALDSSESWSSERGVRIGAAVHSVRAVPRDQIPVVVELARSQAMPLHVHLSEQVAENDQCLRAYGLTPTGLLAGAGALGPATTVVHATHLTADDVGELGRAQGLACLCPTTERDLGDGIAESVALRDAGIRLTVGSDSHAVIDAFEELRAVELDERLASRQRGRWSAAELLTAGTENGQRSLGFDDAGRIAVGCRADLVTLDLHSVRTAGGGASVESAVFAAGADDVRQVMVDGRVVFTEGDRSAIGERLDRAVTDIWSRT